MNAIEVPMICDDRKAPRYIVQCDRPMNREEWEVFAQLWQRFQESSATCIALPHGMAIYRLDDIPPWPGAEYCAA